MTTRLPISHRWLGWLLLLLVIVLGQDVRAQLCPTNMLHLGDDGGHARVVDNPAVRLDRAFTIEAWVKPISASERSTIIEKGNGGSLVNYSIACGPSSTIVARVLGPSGVIAISSDPITNITDWHHVALVYRPGDTLVLYIDGQYAVGVKANAAFLEVGADSLRIGRSILSSGKPFLGSIDELRIWKTARTEEQIREFMDTVISPRSTGLSAYFTFDDEPSNKRIYDNVHKGIIAELKGNSDIIPSSSPVHGRASMYKLEVREAGIRLPRMACAGGVDTVIHVRNLGMDSVSVNFLGLRYGTAFSIAGPEKLVLPADSTFWGEIRIQFNPLGSGIYIDTLFVGSTSSCAGVIAIALVDTVIAAEIQVTPRTITIPKRLNCLFPINETVTIKNPGITPITVNRAYFEQQVGAKLLDLLDELPLTLEPGQSKNVTVRIEQGPDGVLATKLVFGIDRCDLTASVAISVARESIVYEIPERVEFAERTLFGPVNADTVIVFTNHSAREVLVTNVTLPVGSPFTLADAITNRPVPAGASLNIRVRFATNMCGSYSAGLRIFGVPCGIDTLIPVTMNVVSPKPEFSEVLDIGFTCSTKDTFFVIRNPYDKPIKLNDCVSSEPSAFISLTGFPLTVPAEGEDTVRVRFNPAIQREYVTTLTLNNESCGSTAITLKGGFGTKALVYDRAAVDFGSGCTISNVTRQFTLTNTSPRPVTLIDTNIRGTNKYWFKNLTLPQRIDAGSSQTFVIEFAPEMDRRIKGSAQFVIQEQCETDTIELYGSRESAKLSFDHTTIDFDTVCPGSSSILGVTITNQGIDSVRIQDILMTGNGFTLVEAPSALKLGANTIKMRFSPTTQGSYPGAMTIRVLHCNTVYVVQLQGSGGSNPALTLSSEELQFGSIRVGEGRSMCVEVSNTSCIPLTLTASSFSFSDPAFYLDPISEDALPITLENGEVRSICFIYKPDGREVNEIDLPITVVGADPSHIILSGKGVAPVLEVREASLDFGFVPVDTEKQLELHVKNVGNADAVLAAYFIPSSDFNLTPVDPVLEPGDSIVLTVSFVPSENIRYEPITLTLGEPDYEEYVDVRGVGAARGLVVDRTIVDYGDVRLMTRKTELLRITANVLDVTLKDFSYEGSDASSHYSITFDNVLPFVFDKPGKELVATLIFEPKEEAVLDRALVLNADQDDVDDLTIPLFGTGVEAHIWTEDTIDFGVVGFEDSLDKPFTIKNEGAFTLTVESSLTALPFFVEPLTSIEVEPGESRTFSVGFSPQQEKEVRGVLRIRSDGAEGERKIVLIGRGGTVSQSKPRIAYHVPNIETQIGQHSLIPITISGNKLDKIVSDSFAITLRYDPWMLYLYGFSDFATLSNGFDVKLERLDDSTILISGKGGVLNLRDGASLIDLKGEALFGPRPRTTMQVVEAYPSTISSLANAVGEFYITNCNDEEAGAVFKGSYSVEHVFPNPANERATLRYTLGFPGSAEVTLHDALGRVAKVVSLPEKPKGDHEFDINLQDLPNGHYTGLFRSREFIKRIDLVVQH